MSRRTFSSICRMGARARAAPMGSATTDGSAHTVWRRVDTANSAMLRSRMAPRSAGSTIDWMRWDSPNTA